MSIVGKYRGLVVRWYKTLQLRNVSFLHYVVCVEFHPKLNKFFDFINVHGPFMEREVLWDSFFVSMELRKDNAMVGWA